MLIIGNTNISDGLGSERIFFMTLDELTNLEEAQAERMDLKIYPNPTKDFLQLENLPFSANTSIEIFDMMGRLVKQTSYLSPVSISDLAKGNYLLKVHTEEGMSSILWSKIGS